MKLDICEDLLWNLLSGLGLTKPAGLRQVLVSTDRAGNVSGDVEGVSRAGSEQASAVGRGREMVFF